MCTENRFVHLPRTLQVYSAPLRDLKVYTAHVVYTVECTDIVHYTCSVLHEQQVCTCCMLFTALTPGIQSALLDHVVHVWTVPACTMWSISALLRQYVAAIRSFRYINALLVQNISWVTHYCSETLCIAVIFRQSNVPLQPLTAWFTDKRSHRRRPPQLPSRIGEWWIRR